MGPSAEPVAAGRTWSWPTHVAVTTNVVVALLVAAVNMVPSARGDTGGPTTRPFHLAPHDQGDGIANTAVPDCAANSVFLIARLCGLDTPYERCLELLPVNPDGNSGLDVKRALLKVGIEVTPLTLSPAELASLRTPAILWDPPAQVPGLTKVHALGHFSVVRPLSHDRFQTIDFPTEPVVFGLEDWRKYLLDQKIAGVQAFECKRAAAGVEPGVSPRSSVGSPAGQFNAVVVVGRETEQSMISRIDVGNVAEGRLVKACFRLRNHTGRTLTIEKIDWQCTCTSVTTDAREIGPDTGCDLMMDVSMVHRYAPFEAVGVVQFSESSSLPPMFLKVAAAPHGRWAASPAVVDLGDIDPTAGRIDREVRITPTAYAGSRSLISRVVPKSGALSCLLSTDPRTRESKVRITFDPQSVAGVYVGQVYYYCDGEADPANMIEVRGEARPVVSASPSQVMLFPDDAGRASAQVRFTGDNGKNIRMVSAEPSGDAVSATAVVGEGSSDTVQGTVRTTGRTDRTTTGQIRYGFMVEGNPTPYEVIIPYVVVAK
jgi:hypothetical protein